MRQEKVTPHLFLLLILLTHKIPAVILSYEEVSSCSEITRKWFSERLEKYTPLYRKCDSALLCFWFHRSEIPGDPPANPLSSLFSCEAPLSSSRPILDQEQTFQRPAEAVESCATASVLPALYKNPRTSKLSKGGVLCLVFNCSLLLGEGQCNYSFSQTNSHTCYLCCTCFVCWKCIFIAKWIEG